MPIDEDREFLVPIKGFKPGDIGMEVLFNI